MTEMAYVPVGIFLRTAFDVESENFLPFWPVSTIVAPGRVLFSAMVPLLGARVTGDVTWSVGFAGGAAVAAVAPHAPDATSPTVITAMTPVRSTPDSRLMANPRTPTLMAGPVHSVPEQGHRMRGIRQTAPGRAFPP